MLSYRIEKLPLVDEGYHLKGLITIKDIERTSNTPIPPNSNGVCDIAAALGVNKERWSARGMGRAKGGCAFTGYRARPQLGVPKWWKPEAYPDITLIAGVLPRQLPQRPDSGGRGHHQGGHWPGSIVPRAWWPVPACRRSPPLRIAPGRTSTACASSLTAHQVFRRHRQGLAAGASAIMLGNLFAGFRGKPGATETIRDAL